VMGPSPTAWDSPPPWLAWWTCTTIPWTLKTAQSKLKAVRVFWVEIESCKSLFESKLKTVRVCLSRNWYL
jgi:hypothetical protein